MKIRNLNDLYGNHYYVYQYGRWQNQWHYIRKENGKPYFYNEWTGIEIHGIKNINRYMEINNLELRLN